MFASHGRIPTYQVMQLYIQLLEMRTTTPGVSPFDSGPAVDTPMEGDPVDVVHLGTYWRSEVGTWFMLPAPLPDPYQLTIDCHFHILYLDVMEEDRLTDIGVHHSFNVKKTILRNMQLL
ncbi:hypothetical protein PIB30_011750 [Stylosanthes scabra]|uniref:Uncharacterized protein n=1 Tax=Stylosanthes scabra TaxID=79078 RepID=A0ABU6Z7Q7_9FABA|nr:hypothetical protein [Stylosanthes scabra]